jgi:hypothetical protein
LTGDVGDPTNPHDSPKFRQKHRVYYVTSPSGDITWDGVLYSGESTLNQNKENPEYLKSGRKVAIRFDVGIENSFALEYFLWYRLGYQPMKSNRVKRVHGYSVKDPSFYFWKPWKNNIFLAGETVSFQLAWDDADYTVDTVNWETDAGSSGQGSSFQITFPNPGIYTVSASMKYDSNKDGVIDYQDKSVRATCKVNVIQIERFTVVNATGEQEEYIYDTTDDHFTPEKCLYAVPNKGEVNILMQLTYIPYAIKQSEVEGHLLWKIQGGDYNWSKSKGSFKCGIPVTKWTAPINGMGNICQIYAGLDKNNDGNLDLIDICKNKAKLFLTAI